MRLRAWLEAQTAPAAVLFGAERTGLTNEEIDTSHALIRIPASPEYASLNLAMAVQLVSYELFRAAAGDALAIPPRPARRRSPAARTSSGFTRILRRCSKRSIFATARRAERI